MALPKIVTDLFKRNAIEAIQENENGYILIAFESNDTKLYSQYEKEFLFKKLLTVLFKLNKKMRMDFAQMTDLQRVADEMRILASNNYREIPEGYTAIYLRDEPVCVIPDRLKLAVKQLSPRGFFDIAEDRFMMLPVEKNTPEGAELEQQLTDLVVNYIHEQA